MGLTEGASVLNTNRPPKFRGPAYFYPFTYAERSEWILYGVGTVAAMVSGGTFPV